MRIFCSAATPGRFLWLAMAATAALVAPPAYGSGGAPAELGGESAAKPAPVRTDLLNLDGFRIRGCRRTDQEVIDLRFGVCLVLSSKATESDFQRLGHWKNRLRDQVITAVRGANPEDFADPELRRLQRLIVFRMKRLPVGSLILGVYFTDFSMDAGETLADQLVPAVTPSAAPKKSSGGGH
jgi:hypothetical protein